MRTKLAMYLLCLFALSSCSLSEKAMPLIDESAGNEQPTTCSGSLLLEGKFQEKNLYVQNPINETGFCVCSIRVNDNAVSSDSFNSSAFEINLIEMNLKFGDDVKIFMTHYGDCKPKVLNPQVH